MRLLFLNLIKSWCESPIGRRVTIITQTLDRIRLSFTMKVRFSDAFLASHRIMQRHRMQKYICCCSSCDVAFNFSPPRLVSSFWLTVHLCLTMQFISEFMSHLRWNGPTWQAQPIISYFNIAMRDFRRRTSHTAREFQSASQECRFATNQRPRLLTCEQSASEECRFATPTKKKKSQI